MQQGDKPAELPDAAQSHGAKGTGKKDLCRGCRDSFYETVLTRATSLCTDALKNMDAEPIPCAQEQLRGVLDRLQKEQEYDRYFHAKDLPLSVLSAILDHKRHRVVQVIQRSREFQEDVLTFLRAFSLMLENVAGAATHGEKAARLRGLVELVETAAGRVRKRQFSESDALSYSMADDVFHCDYPVRHWIEKAREAEARAKAAEDEARKVRETWAPKPSVGSWAGQPCRACGKPLMGDERIADGCPCNSPRGCNHGIVPTHVCTCRACDPAQTGSVRHPENLPRCTSCNKLLKDGGVLEGDRHECHECAGV